MLLLFVIASALSSCTMMGVINAGYLTTQGACTISNLQTTFWTSIGYYHCPGLQCASGFTPSDSEAPYIYCDWSNGTYEYNGCDGIVWLLNAVIDVSWFFSIYLLHHSLMYSRPWWCCFLPSPQFPSPSGSFVRFCFGPSS